MTCGNCGSRIDWNAIRHCLCYRGPVIGATHRELDDEDRRIRRRIREEMRRENDIASS